MSEKSNVKNMICSILLTLFSVATWASNDIPSDIGGTIEPPPTASIDNYLVLSIVFCVVFVGYYFYKSNKTYLNDEK